jgi:dienelactone hydrolase
MRRIRRTPRSVPVVTVVAVTVLAAAALVAAACSSSEDTATADSTPASGRTSLPTAVSVDGGPAAAAFRDPGPYEVGITTLAGKGRKVEVWYPARSGSTKGLPPATYSLLDTLPPNVAAATPAILPADVPVSSLTVTMADTYRDVPGSTDGPFPLVLFSHATGSYRTESSALLRGIASWGFVVAAPEHVERDRAAVFTDPELSAEGTDAATQQKASDLAKALTVADLRVLKDTIPLVGSADGPLRGLADTGTVGAVGHAMGGRAALSALSLPEIDVAVGWAATGRALGKPAEKPSMNIAALRDVNVTENRTATIYGDLLPPKRLVLIEGAGHNSFTDRCPAAQGGTDLVGLAERLGVSVPEDQSSRARDGCQPGALDTVATFQVIQNFTVAELREGMGLDDSGTGLGKGVAAEFQPVKLRYVQDLA